MSDKLKPCPFCGTKPHHITADLLTRPCFYYECENKTCHAAEKGWHDTEQEAIDAWNTRPIEDALQAEIETLTGKLESAKYSDAQFREKAKLLQVELDQLRNDNQSLVEQVNESTKIMEKFIEIQKKAFLRLQEWNPNLAQDFAVLLTLDMKGDKP